MSNLIASCYATLGGYSWEVSSFYFKGKGGRVDLGEEEVQGGTGMSGGKENSRRDVMYEKRIKKKKVQVKTKINK